MNALFRLAMSFAMCKLLEANLRRSTMEDSRECFLPVVLQYQPQNVHLICEESSHCPSHIVNTIPGIAWTFRDRKGTVILAHEWEDVCIFAADDGARMSNLLKLFVKCHKAKSVLTFPADISSADMKRLFDVAWSVGIVDVVLSKRVDDFCECYTYIPFSDGKCYDFSPVLLDRRLKTAQHVSKTYFPVEKLSGLHLCQLEVHHDILARIPSSKAVARRWYNFVSFLLKAMNAEDKPPLRNTPYTMFQENMTGLGVSVFVRLSYRLPHYVFSPITRRLPCGVCVQKLPISSVQLFRILHEFSYEVWCCIISVFCVSVCYIYAVLRKTRSLPYAFVLCFKTLLNAVTNLKVFRARDRPFLSLWLVVCLVLNAAYQSHLVSDLTVQVSSDAIESIADFLQSDIKILIPADHLYALKEYIWVTPEHVPLIEKAISVNSDLWEIMRPAKKVAYVCNNEDLRVFLPSYHIVPDSVFFVDMSYFVIRKPTPLEAVFVKSALRIFDAGAFVFMERGNPRGFSSRKEWKEKAVAIDLPGLSAVFLLWLCGCFLAFLVFMIEVVKVNLNC